MSAEPKRRLGRGLAALIGDDTNEEAVVMDARSLRHVPVELIAANPLNPRKTFHEEDLSDLANSIREKGLLQPLVVRPLGDGYSYEIVAGERRWRAAQRAGIHDLPVLIRELSDGEALEIALIENIQRSDLSPLEEARGYTQLMEEFSYTQMQLAQSVGKSRSHVANTMRLLALPDKVLGYLDAGEMTAGHARALVANDAAEELAEKIVKQGLSVRDAENLAKNQTPKKIKKVNNSKNVEKSVDLCALEKELSQTMGLEVSVAIKDDESGTLRIDYLSLEQLDLICERLRGK